MLDGRVKTLHPALHGGILARRDRPDDLAALDRLGVGLVDVVIVNLYPFAAAAANPSTTFDALVEEIDIGGPSLVRAAAKNFRHVLVVVDPADYGRLLDAIDLSPSLAFRFDLARKAIAHTASYDTGITTALGDVTLRGSTFVRGEPDLLPSRMPLTLEKIRDLRYGENPHQRAAWYATSGVAPLQPGRLFCKARSCRTRTCSIWMPPRASFSSSTSRQLRSSSTRTPAARPSAARRPRRTCAPVTRIRCRHSAASSRSIVRSIARPPKPSRRRASTA
jgi:hypothetical protein